MHRISGGLPSKMSDFDFENDPSFKAYRRGCVSCRILGGAGLAYLGIVSIQKGSALYGSIARVGGAGLMLGGLLYGVLLPYRTRSFPWQRVGEAY